MMVGGGAFAQGSRDAEYGRNYDLRIPLQVAQRVAMAPTPAQRAAVAALLAEGDDLAVTYDPVTGAAHSVTSRTGYLSGPNPGADPGDLAIELAREIRELLGLTDQDLRHFEVTDLVHSSVSGATHVYLRQTHRNIAVYNGLLQVNVNRDGRILSVNNAFVPDLATVARGVQPDLRPREAFERALDHLGISSAEAAEILSEGRGARQTSVLRHRGVAQNDVTVELFWLPITAGETRLMWNFQLYLLDGEHYFDFNVDATTGEVVTRFDWVSSADFRVYGQPVHSPIHTSPLPPSDARTLVVAPEDAFASPNGWFDAGTTIMDGNNVHACADRNGNNACDSGQPSCGASLVCDFPLNLQADPSNSIPAAIANLFYWNNTIHDVQYQYGFDEAAGNFQESNFSRGGAGSDSVNAEAQDNANGSSNCNANFGTPPDGGNPRMQMFTCDRATPERDGALDNGVVVHEYGHGISIRQVGGPSSSSCLGNRQQAGEGWSDWFALVYTAEAGDLGTDVRGVGSYLFNLGPQGTIRPQPYSTDPAVNGYTYASIDGLSVPHGVGSVWAQAIWEMYWALVGAHGFEPDLLDFDATDPAEAGNKRALFYVNEGLKNTACGPTFVDNRDGILAVAADNFGGEDVCLLWEVFAAFGLGTDAVSGGSNSTTPTNGFSLPAACDGSPPPPPPPDGCLHDATFESGTDGWTQGADTCTTGSFVRGVPDEVVNGGVRTQVAGGDASPNAFFTRPNTGGAGTDDVDGGTCEALSPAVDASAESAVEVSLSYFFGQRDAGGDPADGFTIEVLDDGVVVGTLATIGDVTQNAAWTPASLTVSNPGTLRLRVRATDGTATGDLVEAGVDNARICPVEPVECTVDDGFEGGAAGWSNSGASTCSTGSYVLATPTQVSNGGVITQVGGDHTSGSGNAIFTAQNSSAGVDDVDGGNCILGSPTWNVSQASTLSVWYFHGQRDAGGDASGDFFRLEVSTNGGASWSPVATNGDTTSNAAWTNATASIPAGSSVQLRVQCSDGPATGDLVECGIDDLSICTN
jgi:extracellular elastinolytic metalloproteinase